MKWLITLIIMGFTMHVQAEEKPLETAIFAGGCFWCIESELQELDGVSSVVSGYTGGHVPNPTYEMIGRGDTGHVEAVEVAYDPEQITYETLLDAFWSNIDPTDDGGQFHDRGSHYKTVIFYMNNAQKNLAEASKLKVQAMLELPVATDVLPAKPFYPAEEYHQDYYKTNPLRYNAYKLGSGREGTLNRVWGDKRPSVTESK
jgi:methionine-S-sulfoxide reductase